MERSGKLLTLHRALFLVARLTPAMSNVEGDPRSLSCLVAYLRLADQCSGK
jgi:hypothetical protein